MGKGALKLDKRCKYLLFNLITFSFERIQLLFRGWISSKGLSLQRPAEWPNYVLRLEEKSPAMPVR